MREPFRWFFPLGVLLGVAGVGAWLLMWRGWLVTWPGWFHAGVMMQSFLVAVAVGFLGTMIPRRTKGAPMSLLEAAALTLSLVAVPVCLAWGRPAAAQIAHLVTLAVLALFLVRRRPSAVSPLPPSFLLIPLGLAGALVGGALLVLAPGTAGAVGQQLAQQGLLLFLVLALAPMLAPIVTGVEPAPARPALLVHGALGLALAASFPLETWSSRAGLLLRGATCATALTLACPPWSPRPRPGLHRGLFRLALGLVPLGLLCAGAVPQRRVAWLHVTFIGGLYLLVVAMSAHVVMLHTGREPLASRRPWPLAAATALALAALTVRIAADRFWTHYFVLLALAAALWLASALVWGVFLLAQLLRPA